VKQVTELIGEIAMASREQATGIEQINKAVAQMDQTTQANQAVAEQAALTGRQLDDLSADLAQLVASFSNLEEETPA
jgi:methyl-accepting chemotaxis protein